VYIFVTCVAQTDESARMRTMQPLYSRIPVVRGECEWCVFQRVCVCSLHRCVLSQTCTPFFSQKKNITLKCNTLASPFFSKIFSCDLVARAHNSRSSLSSRKSIPARASSKKEDLWRPFQFLFFSLLRG